MTVISALAISSASKVTIATWVSALVPSTARTCRDVDGTSAETQVAIVTLLAELIAKALMTVTADY